MLARKGARRVIAYDARGHGESSPPEDRGAYGYEHLVDDLEAMLAELRVERAVLAGSSMGAATAMAFALGHPDRVEALVQITPAYDGAPHAGQDEWDALALADALERRDIDAFVELSGATRVPERLRESAVTATRQRIERHRDLTAVADALRAVPRSGAFDGLDRLAEVEAPVLVVGSRDDADPGHPLRVAEEYARRLPQATLVVEPAGQAPLAWRGAQLSRTIAEFLDQV
jgi:pimeloyl-ACP methyl ester carboxylesterase